MTPAEMETAARAASMARAQSPGLLTCQIDGTWSLDDPFHVDPYQICMNFRHQHVVGDDEPWTYWQLIDGPLVPAKGPIPPLPVGLKDWQIRASAGTIPPGSSIPIIPPPQPGATRVWALRVPAFDTGTVDPKGNPILEVIPLTMDGVSSGWNGWTFAVIVYPVLPTIAAYATRITLVGAFTLDSLYMGTVDPNSPNIPFVATNMHQFQFWVDANNNYIANDPGHMNPDGQISPKVIAIRDDAGNFIPIVTEPLPIGFDGTQGWIVSGFFDSGGNGIVGTAATFTTNWVAYGDQTYDLDGNAISNGDTAANIDKSAYTDAGLSSIAVLAVEGLYDLAQVPANVPTSPA